MEHLFDISLQQEVNRGIAEDLNLESIDKEELYVSQKLFSKVSKYLERMPQAVRCSEICEEGWFNKKESYIRKRLKHKRKEGKYCLGISNLHRSFNGKRISRYLLYWLNERDIYYINKELPLEPAGEMAPIDTLSNLYQIIDMDIDKPIRKG
ncbi:MAG: hypothetical protein ACOX25_00155 [Caldicoprobacterales bacterium]|nr:hypothetical protein [Clostridiales bacterium]